MEETNSLVFLPLVLDTAYCLISNLVTLSSCGFIVLSTFIPTTRSCSLVLLLTHFSLFLFIISKFTLHVDFYTAIVFPFWHEYISDKETVIGWCISTFLIVLSATTVLYFVGPLR